ncbi:Alpha-1A adrenergic receptor [Portunus trituberculatus]|uniref:Alpha-1A adrenergic receptor n=1 Tax=Portunus trituberculatus TaxID=210409 RepID=A0A5B7D5X3_PORTR|nr:Alpha-1A adrenergic receptor [Portunus trituberculatus]
MPRKRVILLPLPHPFRVPGWSRVYPKRSPSYCAAAACGVPDRSRVPLFMITVMIAPAMTPHPAQAATSAPHMPAANITSTPEVSIGASILWAFLLTATHNLTLAEHSTLPPGLQHAVPETTSAPLEIYSTPRLQVSTTNPAGVSQPLLLLMSGNKSSVTEFVVEPFRTMPTMFPPLPQESQPTPLVYLIPRKGGRTAGQNRSSLMARLIDDREGGTTLSGGNTVRFSGNGKLLAKPRTMSPVNTQTSGGSKEPPVLLRSSSTHEPPDEDPSSGGGGGGGSGGGGGDQKRLVAGAAATQPKDDKQEQKLKREMKAVYTLLNIVVIFLLCWVPFYILFVLSAWFPTLFPTWYVTFSYWMAYINSAVNPILYPLSSPEFRQAYKKVLRAMIGRA